MKELNVFLGRQYVGVLGLDAGGRFRFQYEPAWLDRSEAIPLSLSLPLRKEPFENDFARPFFANILPEQEIRRKIARRLGISNTNDFALLEALGGECAGAVSILPKEARPTTSPTRYRYKLLSDSELETLINELPNRSLLAGEEGVHLSLAGAQDKLPVKHEGNLVFLPLGGSPSTHILKIPIPGYRETVQNEAFSMLLAQRLGLDVPHAKVFRCSETPVYMIERFDRVRQKGEIIRLHQEDFCQAMGILPDMKYESEGGPGLEDCVALVKNHCSLPVRDLQRLLQWVVFNFLLGNADAHAKNISLLYRDGTVALAPFYDLMCTRVYGKQLTDRMAMAIGKERRLDWIMPRHWERCAQSLGIRTEVVHNLVVDMARRIDTSVHDEAKKFRSAYGESSMVHEITNLVAKRARSTLNRFEG